MPHNDELGREYTKKEARLWREAKHVMLSRGGQVRLVPIGGQFGYNEQQVGQVGRTWQNDGLCVTAQSGRVLLTLNEFGRQFTFEDSYKDIEK